MAGAPAASDTEQGPLASAAPAAAVEPRQRWRIAFERDPVAADRVGRTAIDEWQASLVGSGLPVAHPPSDPERVRLALAAPLPATAAGTRELVDVWLLDRIALWQLRERIAPALPADHRWVDAEDVWLGGPPLPGLVVAADWRVAVAIQGASLDRGRLEGGAAAVLGATTLERTRVKGGTEKRYDLRPLLAGLAVAVDGEPDLLVRTRFDPERGPGRPEEVVAAVADAVGIRLDVRTLTRTRLLLAGDPDV